MSHDRQLDIVDGTLVCHRLTRLRDDDWRIVDVENLLLPSHLRIVHLTIDGADGLEILLAHIAIRETASDTPMLLLRDVGSKAHAAHHITTVGTDGKVVAMLTYLSRGLHTPQEESRREQHPYLILHLLSIIYHLLFINTSPPLSVG